MSGGEIVSTHIGGMGIRCANSFWRKLCKENNVSLSGKAEKGDSLILSKFFRSSNQLIPRSVLADLSPVDVDIINSSDMKSLFMKENVVLGKGEDGNFASGHYTEGAEIICDVLNRIRVEIEACDNVGCLLMFQSLSGGTGGGLGSLVENKAKEEFQCRVAIVNDFSSSRNFKSTLDPYNSILSLNKNTSDVTIFTDTYSLGQLAKEDGHSSPTYSTYNDYISYIPNFLMNNSVIDAGNSIDSLIGSKDRLKFLVPNVITSRTPNILRDYTHYWIGSNRGNLCDVNLCHGRSISFRQTFMNSKHTDDKLNSNLSKIRESKSSYFTDNFDNSKGTLSTCMNSKADESIVLLTNNSAVSSKMKAVSECFSMLFKRKAYLYMYTAIGMDEMEFTEALQGVANTVSEYDGSCS